MAKKLYGTDPDQVPTNADLGTMAYQDKDYLDVGEVHSDNQTIVSTDDSNSFSVTTNASSNVALSISGSSTINGVATAAQSFYIMNVARDSGSGRSTYFNGNVGFPNGYGIDFSASEGSGASSSILDDYEEGTFTPIWYDGFSSITYQLQTGAYVKVGRVVTIQLQLKASAATATANGIIIGGLPYNASDANSAYGGFYLNYNTFNTNSGDTYHKFASNNRIGIYRNIGGQRGGNTSGITPTGEVILSGQYYTD